MLKKIGLYFVLSLGVFVRAQNLVPNGDFETYTTCPNTTSSQFNMQIDYAVGWSQSSLTPDYFNACNGVGGGVYVPYNQLGYQKDCNSGGGYAGCYMFDSNSTNNDDRDYIQIKLSDTLKAGQKYLASIYVSRANFNYSISSIGMLFTDSAINLPWPQGYIPANPQVKSAYLISDTTNWIMVQDTFIANGTESHLIIGNFNTNASSGAVMSPGTWWYYYQAYYFIDNVSIYEINGTCDNYWDAGFNKYIFAGDSIRLGAINTDGSTFLWQNSTGGSTYLSNNADARPWSTPSITTTYYVTKTCPNNNVFNDTVTVFVQPHVGINEIPSNGEVINISPNPSNGNFAVQYNLKENSILEISDISGKLVGKYNLPVNSYKLQISNEQVENGVYLYRIVSNGSLIKASKIIVMK